MILQAGLWLQIPLWLMLLLLLLLGLPALFGLVLLHALAPRLRVGHPQGVRLGLAPAGLGCRVDPLRAGGVYEQQAPRAHGQLAIRDESYSSKGKGSVVRT